jgi:hypothetical protein
MAALSHPPVVPSLPPHPFPPGRDFSQVGPLITIPGVARCRRGSRTCLEDMFKAKALMLGVLVTPICIIWFLLFEGGLTSTCRSLGPSGPACGPSPRQTPILFKIACNAGPEASRPDPRLALGTLSLSTFKDWGATCPTGQETNLAANMESAQVRPPLPDISDSLAAPARQSSISRVGLGMGLGCFRFEA